MNVPSEQVEKARALVERLWEQSVRMAEFCKGALRPLRDTRAYLVVAEFALEVRRAWKASGERDGRA